MTHSCKYPFRSVHREAAGFSLVETLVAAAVFVVVFAMLATLFGQATSGFSGKSLLIATTLAQSAIQKAVESNDSNSKQWTLNSNGIQWEIKQIIEEMSNHVQTVQVVISRTSDGKTYASLWTQVYRPTDR